MRAFWRNREGEIPAKERLKLHLRRFQEAAIWPPVCPFLQREAL